MIVGEHNMGYPFIFPWPDMVIILITWMIGIHIAIAAACCDCGSIHNYASYPFHNHRWVQLWPYGRWDVGRPEELWRHGFPTEWNRKSPQLQAASKLHLGDISYLFKSTNQLLLRLVLSAMSTVQGTRYGRYGEMNVPILGSLRPASGGRYPTSASAAPTLKRSASALQFGSLIGEKSQAFSSFLFSFNFWASQRDSSLIRKKEIMELEQLKQQTWRLNRR